MSGLSEFFWAWIVTRAGRRELDAGSLTVPIEATLTKGYARKTSALEIPPLTSVNLWAYQAGQEETFEGQLFVADGDVDVSWMGDKPTDIVSDPPDLTPLGTHETWNTVRMNRGLPQTIGCQDITVNPVPADHASGGAPPEDAGATPGLIYRIEAYNPSATETRIIERYWAQ